MLADDLEYKWKRSKPRYTEKELVEIFSPPKEMIIEKIKDREKEQETVIEKMKQTLRYVYAIKTDKAAHLIGELVIKTDLLPQLNKYNGYIAKLKRILNILTPESFRDTRQDDVEHARQYPIYEITKYRLLLRRCGNKYSALCPFHEEKHESFYIYPETNTYHCFGCQENGDIIQLTRHLYDVSFREAVKMLQK
jgi:hypothetical protein